MAGGELRAGARLHRCASTLPRAPADDVRARAATVAPLQRERAREKQLEANAKAMQAQAVQERLAQRRAREAAASEEYEAHARFRREEWERRRAAAHRNQHRVEAGLFGGPTSGNDKGEAVIVPSSAEGARHNGSHRPDRRASDADRAKEAYVPRCR